MKFRVAPAEAGVRVPPHPIHGPIEATGSDWLADQYTLRLILDGTIRRVEDEPVKAPKPAKAPRPAKVTEPAAKATEPAEITDDHTQDERAPGDAEER